MLVKILGAFDVFVALILFLAAVSIFISIKLLIILAVGLAIKSIPSLSSFCVASIIDVAIIIILIVCIFTPINAIMLLIAAFAIAQKGVMSFI